MCSGSESSSKSNWEFVTVLGAIPLRLVLYSVHDQIHQSINQRGSRFSAMPAHLFLLT